MATAVLQELSRRREMGREKERRREGEKQKGRMDGSYSLVF